MKIVDGIPVWGEPIENAVAQMRNCPEMMREWVSKSGVELRGAGVDESPHCYKRLGEVLNAHSDTVKIVETLRPIGVAMAGSGEYDPYRD